MDSFDIDYKNLFLENEQLKKRIDNQDFLLKSQGKELKELYSIIDKAIKIFEKCEKTNDFSTCDIEMYESLKGDDTNEQY